MAKAQSFRLGKGDRLLVALGTLAQTREADRPKRSTRVQERRVLRALGALGQAAEAGGTEREIKALESRVVEALDAFGRVVRPAKSRSLSTARKGRAAA